MAKKKDRKKGRKKKAAPDGYNVKMIRDFLDHLIWEVRTSHHESTTHVGSTHPELIDQLATFMEKYGVGLLVTTVLKDGDDTPEQRAEAIRIFQAGMQKLRQEQLNHLDALQSLFAEALHCAARPGVQPVRHVTVAELLASKDGDGGKPSDPA